MAAPEGYPPQGVVFSGPGGGGAPPPQQAYPPQQLPPQPGVPPQQYPPQPQQGYPPQQLPPQPGMPPQQAYAPQPGYPAQPGLPPQPGMPPQQAYAPQPGYPAQPGLPPQPGMVMQQPGMPPPMQAPAQGGWAPNYAAQTKYAGMEPLVDIGALYIEQKVDLLEAAANAMGMNSCEQPNTYYIFDGLAPPEYQKKDTAGHLFTVKETSTGECCDRDMLCRCCCNPYHEMKLDVVSQRTQQPVFTIDRPFKGCGWACFPCCLQQWIVKSPSQEILGTVTQPLFGGCFHPRFDIMIGPPENAEDGTYTEEHPPAWFLRGPHCIGEFCTVDFFLHNAADEAEIGQITKLGNSSDGGGIAQELLTDADKFSFNFPKAAPAEDKAVALTAMILLDYYFFENGGAFACDPFAAPGEECCRLNLCSQYCCGCAYTWALSCNKPDGGE